MMKKLTLLLFLVLSTAACVPQFPVLEDTIVPTATINQPATRTPKNTETYPQINQIDLLAQNPCSGPCFFGITPGITTEEEANALVEEYPSVFRDCYYESASPDASLPSIKCKDIVMGVLDGYVISIQYRIEPPKTLQQVIAILGPPDKLHFFIDEGPIIASVLFYDTYQMVIYLPDFEGTQYIISEDVIVDYIFMFDVEGYQLRIPNYRKLVPWDGYRVYEVTE